MKYLLACLIIPAAQMLFVVVIALGVLFIGVDSLLASMRSKKSPAESRISP